MLLKRALVSSLALVALKSPQESAAADARGVFVRLAGETEATFVPWTGEAGVQAQLDRLSEAGGGEVIFAAGDYELETGFRVTRARDLRIAGSGRFEPRRRRLVTVCARPPGATHP